MVFSQDQPGDGEVRRDRSRKTTWSVSEKKYVGMEGNENKMEYMTVF